ncbi:MAG: bifunctional proline dehydrogenase/L-glutamate gamma-semialdehyde dehydrogenase PutA [Gammaproteobacteria bacterium]|jgi:RHH-type proline utilization regulon transcriptional repressor/proline dehydrogenase/delta 1-pyrroline-5-carboxylate dehydrogenase|nr:bifunctional proline dehydrogenase/L-glutamate gamma-semialdehyde dehydrogenase PutA [Gammaproteobacteria bacterium]
MIFDKPLPQRDGLRGEIAQWHRRDETEVVERLLDAAHLDRDSLDRIAERARALVGEVRRHRIGKGGIDAFMQEYELSSQEGVVLMCLAEALLRIPDQETADRLIRDKLGPADWEKHVGNSESVFVNASTWALMLTGRVVSLHEYRDQSLKSVLGRLVGRFGDPVIRQSITQGMRILGRQFVMGRSITEALDRASADEERGYRHSFDMLGEAAHTAADAKRYFDAYSDGIATIGAQEAGRGPIESSGISIKLSALHPRYAFAQRERVMAELVPRLMALATHAREVDIGFTVDAEEADRLELSLDIIASVFSDDALKGWEGFGLALQTYQKRAYPTVEWLAELARANGRRLMLRLTKGAYWDSEIKLAQEGGYEGYTVFTRKAATDVSYIACARRVLAHGDAFFPQFATHNAHTLATIVEMAGQRRDYEFQRLHGMGEALYEQVVGSDGQALACRIYAPVGSHEDLLPYLVRRLLENGSNTSFVNRIVDERAPVDDIIADPLQKMQSLSVKPHPRIPAPPDIYQPERRNSRGIDISDPMELQPLDADMRKALERDWRAAPLIGGVNQKGERQPILDPADRRRQVGTVITADPAQVDIAMTGAANAAPAWDAADAEERALALERTAELMERDMPVLMALAVREAGKTVPDAIAEIREAVDFCRYYAGRCRRDFAEPMSLPGPTGERNELSLHGRGVFACISPWNFPLAIFTGQVTAALAAGNAVVAKPAEQTPLIAHHAVTLMHEAGVPAEVLQLLPGDGETVGTTLVNNPLIGGVVFTGSTETARAIHKTLASKGGPIVPLIAETGGQNAMIVDSSALPEQVVTDTIASAFQSAGQRCSALRVLYLQSDIADKTIEMLTGAMAELTVGDPALLSTDVGPVIDATALEVLETHAARMGKESRLIHECALGSQCAAGTFFAPRAFEIESIAQLEREVFGPILHVIRFRAAEVDAVIDDINATGYGLTVGIHSRIDTSIEYIHSRLKVGNTYVNRNQIGAVVGVQPFGGEGLSGTGPKAGGPRYLYRFATERSLSVNTTAQGGNASLMSLDED